MLSYLYLKCTCGINFNSKALLQLVDCKVYCRLIAIVYETHLAFQNFTLNLMVKVNGNMQVLISEANKPLHNIIS